MAIFRPAVQSIFIIEHGAQYVGFVQGIFGVRQYIKLLIEEHTVSNNDNDGVSFVDRNIFQDGDLVPTTTGPAAAEGSESGAREHLWTNAAGAGATLAGACNAGPAPEQLSYVAVERFTRGRPAAHPAWLVSRLRKHIHGETYSLLPMMPILVCFCSLPIFQSTLVAQSPGISANDLARRVIDNELRTEDQDKTHWIFRIETRKPDSGSEVDEVIQTSKGEFQLHVLINGHPPDKTEEEKAESRIQQLVNNPAAAQKSRKEKSEDYSRSRRMLKMLPEAFIYTYGGRQGDRVQLNFRPNPRFRSHSFEEEVFHAMDGSLWVDEKQNRLAQMSGHLTNGVKFLGGLLGHLDNGGSFEVSQELVAPGCWDWTVLNVHITASAVFFQTIVEQQQLYRKEFKRIPDHLTLAQADEMLKKEVASHRTSPAQKQGF